MGIMTGDADRPLLTLFPGLAVGALLRPDFENLPMAGAAGLWNILCEHGGTGIGGRKDAMAAMTVRTGRSRHKTFDDHCLAVYALEISIDQSGCRIVTLAAGLDLCHGGHGRSRVFDTKNLVGLTMTTLAACSRCVDTFFNNPHRILMAPRTNVTAREFLQWALLMGNPLNIGMTICAF